MTPDRSRRPTSCRFDTQLLRSSAASATGLYTAYFLSASVPPNLGYRARSGHQHTLRFSLVGLNSDAVRTLPTAPAAAKSKRRRRFQIDTHSLKWVVSSKTSNFGEGRPLRRGYRFLRRPFFVRFDRVSEPRVVAVAAETRFHN